MKKVIDFLKYLFEKEDRVPSRALLDNENFSQNLADFIRAGS